MVAAFAVGVGLARAGEKHEHDYSEDRYVLSDCCRYQEQYDCREDDSGTRICSTRCGSWGKRMKRYLKCSCGSLSLQSQTDCRDDL